MSPFPAALLALPGNERMADALATALALPRVAASVHRFPDGESLVRVDGNVQGRDVILVCTLNQPDDKFVPLFLMAHAAREAGARRVLLVAPYLPYMRQDVRFRAGETVSARHVAAWISSQVDGLITVDPHLHRIHDLAEIYAIPHRVVHAAPALAAWIRAQVARPVLIGPDEESAQWVAEVAQAAQAPHVVLTKTRLGDRKVRIDVPALAPWQGHTPVLVDDIVSTAHTMMEVVQALRQRATPAPVCVAVHAVFARTAYEDLQAAGAGVIVSTDTIAHDSNRIALSAPLAQAIRELL